MLPPPVVRICCKVSILFNVDFNICLHTLHHGNVSLLRSNISLLLVLLRILTKVVHSVPQKLVR